MGAFSPLCPAGSKRAREEPDASPGSHGVGGSATHSPVGSPTTSPVPGTRPLTNKRYLSEVMSQNLVRRLRRCDARSAGVTRLAQARLNVRPMSDGADEPRAAVAAPAAPRPPQPAAPPLPPRGSPSPDVPIPSWPRARLLGAGSHGCSACGVATPSNSGGAGGVGGSCGGMTGALLRPASPSDAAVEPDLRRAALQRALQRRSSCGADGVGSVVLMDTSPSGGNG